MKVPRRKHLILYCMGAVLTFGHSSILMAEPWIEAGDQRSRHHLQVLADGGLINLPLTSWPVMWSGINRELNDIELADLSEAELWSYQYLRHELRRAQRDVSAGQQISANSSRPGLTDYATDSRERLESRSYASYTGNHWAVKLQASAVDDPIDNKQYRVDGSYLAGIWGNWALGVGAIDRWWGPGWQSSLILSNNARPAPGLFINRVDNAAFDLPVLKWLGPWDLRFFLNQLEGERNTPHAKLFGMRVSFKPFRQLELGLSRTAQLGGDGRPEDLSTFWKMFTGKDNRKDGEDGTQEPGNQLGGVDWRLGQSFGGFTTAFYGQAIGEDEAGGLPYKLLGMAGLETSFVWGATHNRLALEASNTTMEFNKGGTPNVAYEHPLYQSGYRYYGRPLGASTDNDSELAVLKGLHNLVNGHHLSWTLGSGKINVDGSNKTPGGNIFGAGAIDLWYATATYSLPISKHSQVSIGGQYYDNALEIRGQPIETSVYITYKLRL